MILLRTTHNWADEFDADSIYLISEDNLEKLKKAVNDHFDQDKGPIQIWFGTNEYIYLESYQEAFGSYNCKEIKLTNEETKAVRKALGGDCFGIDFIGNLADAIECDIYDEDEYNS